MAWSNNNSLGNPEVYFTASNNNGLSFHTPVKLSNADVSTRPVIAAAGNNVYIVWQAYNGTANFKTLLRASNNNGTSFGNIKNINNDNGNAVYPQIAASGTYTYVTFQDDVSGSPGSTDVFFSVSSNSGGTFSAKVNLSSDKNSVIPQIAATGNNVYVAWRDKSSPPDQIYLKSSTNNGNSFTAPSTGISLCKNSSATCFVQQIAATGTSVYVVWQEDTPSTDDVFVAVSTNSGSSFGNPVNLSNNANSVNPVVDAAGSNVYVAWENHANPPASTVSLSVSSNSGTSFGSAVTFGSSTGFAELPQIAAIGTNMYLTWEDTSGTNDLFFVSSGDSGQTFGTTASLGNNSGSATLPVVTGAGNYAYVAWQDDTPGNLDIFFRAGTTAVPDVAISGMALSRAFAYSGVTANPIIVNVTASNPGPVTASFVVSVKVNSTFIASNQNVTNLAPGGSVLLQFSWNIASLARGNYTLTAYASQVTPLGETNLSNNVLTWGGTFKVRANGDVDGDCATTHVIDIVDVATDAASFGSSAGSAGPPAYNPYADVNNNGLVNIIDVATVASVFGTTC